MAHETRPAADYHRISQLATLINGFPFDSVHFRSDAEMPLVRIRDLGSEEFETFVSPEVVPPSAIIRNGDVVIGMDGDFNSLLWRRGEAALNQRVCLLRARPDVDPRYIAYALPTQLKRINDLTWSTTVKHLSGGQVRAIRIPAHSHSQQRAIADYLDRETARIDAFIAKNEELVALLTERRAACIDEAFERLGAPLTRLKYCASIQTGVTLGGDGSPSDPEWPYLRVANVQVGRVELKEVKSIRVPEHRARQSLLRVGDVLMTEGGDRDKLGRGALWSGEITPMLHQNHVFAVKVGRNLDARFLMRWLDASPSRRHFESTAVQTTNLASTNKTLVGNLPLPSCPVQVQLTLVADLDLRLEKIDAAIGVTERSVKLAWERRAALISAAVTGKLDVEESV